MSKPKKQPETVGEYEQFKKELAGELIELLAISQRLYVESLITELITARDELRTALDEYAAFADSSFEEERDGWNRDKGKLEVIDILVETLLEQMDLTEKELRGDR